MDFVAEYAEMCTIPSKIAVTYKFFELFKVYLKDSEEGPKGLHWSYASDTNLSDETLVAFKALLKFQRSQLKKLDTPSVNCGKMLWFFYQKLLDVGAFNAEVRRDILAHMDLCEYIIM